MQPKRVYSAKKLGTFLFVSALLFLSVTLRLWNIEWGLPNALHNYSFHPDENFALNTLQTFNLKTWYHCPNFVWGPFYYYVLGFVLKAASFFGLLILNPSVDFYKAHIIELKKIFLIGRLLTVFWGIVCVYLSYLLGRLLSGKKAGLIAAFLASVMPFAVIQSHYLSVHMQFSVFVLLALIACLKAQESDSFAWHVLFAVSTALAIGTYWFLGATPLVAFLYLCLKKSRKEKFSIILSRRIIPVFLLIGIILFAAAPGLFIYFADFLREWKEITSVVYWFPPPQIIGPFVRAIPSGLGWPLYLLGVAGIFLAAKKRQEKGIMLLLWLLAYYLMVSFTGSYKWVRRFTPLLFVMVTLGSVFLAEAWEWQAKKTWGRRLIAIGGAGVFLYSFLISCVLLDTMNHDTHEAAAAWINRSIPAHKRIAIIGWKCAPQLDIHKYIFTTEIAPDHLGSGEFDYYIISEYYFTSGMELAPTRNLIRNGIPGYSLLATFEYVPSFLGMRFSFYEDRYANPAFYIFIRSGKSKEGR